MTAGKVLQEGRLKKAGSLEAIAKETRIKEKFLRALEDDDYTSLPGLPTALGFARSYARVLDLDGDLVCALLRRDFPTADVQMKTKEVPLVPATFWTPRTTVFVAVFATVLLLGAYLVRQYLLFAGHPPLEITKITENGEKFELLGKTTPAATVEVNGQAVLVEEDGSFRFQTDSGETLEINAVSRTGKKTTIRRDLSE